MDIELLLKEKKFFLKDQYRAFSMVLKKAKNTVKGTTKVSFGDRLLIKKLFMADRNSKQKKQKRSKEISQDYKIRLANAPHRKSQEAYQHWLKKARDKELTFEFQPSDDILAVTAMCQPDWEALCLRQSRMQALQTLFETVASEKGEFVAKENSKASEHSAMKLLETMASILEYDSTHEVPLLVAGRHKRASNYRRKIRRKKNLLDAHVTCREVDPTYALASESDNILCEPVPACDYETCEPSIFYTCAACSEPVCSTKMHIEHNGAFDAIFFHPECFAPPGFSVK